MKIATEEHRNFRIILDFPTVASLRNFVTELDEAIVEGYMSFDGATLYNEAQALLKD